MGHIRPVTRVSSGAASCAGSGTVSSPGGDPPDIVQHSFADDDATSSLDIVFDTNTTAGNTLVAWVRMGTDGTQTVTHGGKTFTKLHEDGWLGWDFEVYALANCNAGTTVNVSTTSGADVIRAIIAEFENMPAALNLDDTASNTGSGTTANAGQVTVIEDGSLVLMGFAVDSDPEGYTANAPLQLISEPLSDKVAAGWQVANAGNLTPTMGLNSGDWAAITVVLGP